MHGVCEQLDKMPFMTTQPRWLSDEEQHLWRLMLAATRQVARTLDETLQTASGLSSSEFAVLVALSEAEDHVLRLRELCAALSWDRSRTSHQITRMDKRGLVTKAKSPGDARGVLITLTQDGWERLESAAPDHVENVRRLVFDHIKREDFAEFEDFLERVIDSRPTA